MARARPKSRPATRRPVRSPHDPAHGKEIPLIAPRRSTPEPIDLNEDPHAHVVCRVCGRIAGLALQQTDLWMLTEVAERRPEGWSVDGITYTLTGACPRCREGPAP
ncbi:MAG: hypothetical protein WAN87_09350 [Thermoplasmata archaeon]